MNDNISINDMLKNATERAKKKTGMNSEPKKGYRNWDDYPKDDAKPFDLKKTTESLSKTLNNFSSTVSVKLAQSASKLNERINEKKDEKTKPASETDLATAYPELLNEWEPENKEDRSTNSSFLSAGTMEDITERFRQASQKARESEAFGKISRTLNDYKMSFSEALDGGERFTAEHIDDSDGSNLFSDIKSSHSPVVVSGKEKGRVVQELSDAARYENVDIEQIPMVLKDDISLRRLVSEVRENKNKNRVIVLDIVESPNAEQLRIFEKFVEDAKNGNFYLVILSDDDFSNSWFVINGAIQRIYDF